MQAPWQKLGFQLKLGLRPRQESCWLPRESLFGNDAERGEQIRQKQHLFAHNYADIFAAFPSASTASAEMLQMVCDHITSHHHAPLPDIDFAQHPLEAAARLVPEDLLLLAPRRQNNSEDPSWHLEAAALAFPAHWVLAEKMGHPMQMIHQPVPHYDERLAHPVDRFFTAMKIGPISSRMNWSLQIGSDLFTPQRVSRKAVANNDDLHQLFLRIENQTLRKLPDTGYIVFTIRTHMLPMTLWQDDRDALQSMSDMMQNMSQATKLYKGVPLYEPLIRRALARLDPV